MKWKNQLTKTPYLVLFIVLISIGVGTASALITITLSGNVHVTGDTTMDGTLGVGTDTPDAAFHVVGGGSDFTPNKQGVQITGSDASNSPGIELTGNGEPPYIDFQNDITGTDFDGRIILTDDDTLSITGANLECPNCILGFYQIIQLEFEPAGGSISRTAVCDSLDIVMGGGFLGPGDVQESSPYFTNNSWKTSWINAQGGVQYGSYAICADYAPVHVEN